MQDVITRDIIVKTKKEKVYEAITNPKMIVTWFPESIAEGSLEVGKKTVFVFDESKSEIYVVAAKPFEYFSYRWVPGGNGVEGEDLLSTRTTLVEFFIEDQAEGTKVTVKESGFSSLPTEIAEESFKMNSGGWEYMMSRLLKVLS